MAERAGFYAATLFFAGPAFFADAALLPVSPELCFTSLASRLQDEEHRP